MKRKSIARGAALCAAAALVAGLTAGAANASDSNYVPTLLGNDSYTNQADARNDYVVEGIEYTSPISSQNADTVASAKSLGVTMGDASDAALPIVVENNLDQAVTSISWRTSSTDEFVDLKLSGTLESGAQACWYYEPAYAEQQFENELGSSYVMPQNYTLRAVLADGATAEFHDINLNGVRTVTMCYSPDYDVNYVERTTITNHTPDPNLYYEATLAGYDGDAFTLNYHVNSSASMNGRMFTASRGSAWETGEHTPTQTIEDFGIVPPLYGYFSSDFNDGFFDISRWNSDDLTWRLPAE